MNPSTFKESGGGGGGSGETTAKMDFLELKLGFGSSSSSLPLSSPTPAPVPAPVVVERCNNGLWWSHNHKQLGLFVTRDSSSDEYEYEYEYNCCLPSSPLLGTFFWSAFPCNDGSHQYYHCSQPVAGLWFSLRSIINRDGEVLPQVPKAYIRVNEMSKMLKKFLLFLLVCFLPERNENLTVLMVKTYLVKKLGLSNESQVEISCMGQNLLEYQELKKVRDEIWLPKLVENFQSSNRKSVQNSRVSSNHLIMPLDYGKCCLYMYIYK